LGKNSPPDSRDTASTIKNSFDNYLFLPCPYAAIGEKFTPRQ